MTKKELSGSLYEALYDYQLEMKGSLKRNVINRLKEYYEYDSDHLKELISEVNKCDRAELIGLILHSSKIIVIY